MGTRFGPSQNGDLMRLAKETELAYAAGFFDGEGWITIETRRLKNQPNINWRLRIGAGQDSVEPLLIFQEIWGGTIIKAKTRANGKTSHQWWLSTNMASRFLRDVLPYLIVKRRQAEIAIEFRNGIDGKVRPGVKGLSKEELDRRYLLRDELMSQERRRRPAQIRNI